ncbi:hypothetical protein GN316_08495 [Xylophilus sp. Kf1]|nr:hypothetical protein [Xylophilus sp. Kf1]
MQKTVLKMAMFAAVAAASVAAQAQQPATTTAPANVGVTQSTANEAANKAVPRSDTATLVRTAPNAADRTKAAADSAQNSVGGTGTTANTTNASGGGMATAPAPMQRARKADRN